MDPALGMECLSNPVDMDSRDVSHVYLDLTRRARWAGSCFAMPSEA